MYLLYYQEEMGKGRGYCNRRIQNREINIHTFLSVQACMILLINDKHKVLIGKKDEDELVFNK